MFLKTRLKLYDTAEAYNWHDGNKNNLKTIEAQIVQKLKNNEARPKFAGSYKKSVRLLLRFSINCIPSKTTKYFLIIKCR